MGPRSYKDLEDPKYKGLIVLSEPIGPSPGSRWAAYAWKAYGDEHLKKVIGNVKALTRAEIDAPKQIARGEYGIFIHPTQVGAADIWKLPKPHPFRLVVPEDGVMLLMGGINLLQGAPHPNAAKVFMNYLLTKPAQQIQADDPGGPFIRRDVNAVRSGAGALHDGEAVPEQSGHLRVRLEALLRVVGEGRALSEGGRSQVGPGWRHRAS